MAKPPHLELLYEVGRGLHCWSLVEMALADLFQAMVGYPNANPHALFNAVINFDTRLTLCDKAMEFADLDPVEREMWIKLSAKLTKFYKRRHEIAHFSVGKEGVILPFVTTANWQDKNRTKLNAGQIRERAFKFLELEMALKWFADLMPRTRMPLQRQHLQPHEEPPPVVRLRALAVQSLEERESPPQS